MASLGFHFLATNLCNYCPFYRLHSSIGIRRKNLRTACSAADDVQESMETGDGWSGEASSVASESPVSTSKRASSIISTLNVQKAMRGIAITDIDHYGRLGIARGTSYEEVSIAYNRKCEDLMDQKLGEDETEKQLLLLKESHEILSTDKERRLYDWSLARTGKPDRYMWPFEVDIKQTPEQMPPPQEPEDVGPTILLGYFFLAWIILSIVLSAILSRS
ncbi:hypothetical protein ZOSMA_87G00270 [Zostera marina]|uniref:J domain-containing protein n=1 Tax=Zostera marina TaxID=29655 RepID=A0A0K9NMS9_ZOSMR|nr:hypothetical protein ZOSMA_87G00270 [Zostera marina]